MWETTFNIIKLVGAVAAVVTVVMVLARVWSGTAREQLITLLKAELQVSRNHCEQADRDVKHYRDEMHEVRGKTEAAVKTAQADLEDAKEKLKQVEIQNAELRAKTDLSPVMGVMTEFITEQREFIKEQTEINGQVLAALTKLAGKG